MKGLQNLLHIGKYLVASLLLVAMPGAPSRFLLLVVRPGAPSSVLVPYLSVFELDGFD